MHRQIPRRPIINIIGVIFNFILSQIQINMEHSKNHLEMTVIHERDRAELRETLQQIAMSVEELRTIQRMQSPATAEIMQSIEEVRHCSNCSLNI